MKSFEVTDEQYAQLNAVCEALAEDVRYGHVRPRDAVQYLLDTHDDGDVNVAVDASAASETADTATEPGDADGADDEDDTGEVADVDTGDADAPENADESDAASAETSGSEAGETDDGGTDSDDASGAATPTPTPGGGSGDKMSAMMNLLDTHDEKWERADSQETRYVVDLPDGATEEVQTKDDVKAILFKNY